MGTGELSDDWRAAFEQVPRHSFIPGEVWRINHEPGPAQGRLFPLRREDDPDTWLELAYADDYAVTQVDDGQPAPEGGCEVTSSASAPSVVAHMLAALDVRQGMRVLEIGTGTGLAQRAPAEPVAVRPSAAATGTLARMTEPAVLSREALEEIPALLAPSARDEAVSVAERATAVVEAVASVRAEGLEPSAGGLADLDAFADGKLDADAMVARMLGRYQRDG